jgi:hypothetical protein
MRRWPHCLWRAAALWLAALLLGGTLTSAQGSSAPGDTDVADPVETLWVGNSFFYSNNSLHSHVESLARAADPASRLRGVSVTISGAGLDWHDLESYLRPGALGDYSFDADNRVVFAARPRHFDTVVLMDCSQCPIHPQLAGRFHATVRRYSETTVAHGARPVLFMSWAYADRPEMTVALAEQYTLAGRANNALVIPAGLAFANAIAARPHIGLYQTDQRHPSMRGTYLAACTAYAALLHRSPVGNPYTAGIDPSIAAFLQAVAWDTVLAYRHAP